MKVSLLVVVVMLLLFGLLLWLPISVQVLYERRGHDDQGSISMRWLFGLVRLHRRLLVLDTRVDEDGPALHIGQQSSSQRQASGTGPIQEKKISAEDVKQFIADLPEWIQLWHRLQPVTRALLSRVHVAQFTWHTRLGTGNAVTCGMSCGAAWATTSTMVGALSQVCQLDQMPDILVVPDFDCPRLETTFECILRVRAGYAIRAGFGLIRVWRRRQTTHGASDSRTHAHGDDQYP